MPGTPGRGRRHRPAADGQEPSREHADPRIYAKPTFDAVAEATARLDPARRRLAPDLSESAAPTTPGPSSQALYGDLGGRFLGCR